MNPARLLPKFCWPGSHFAGYGHTVRFSLALRQQLHGFHSGGGFFRCVANFAYAMSPSCNAWEHVDDPRKAAQRHSISASKVRRGT